jgi:UDP-N-acetylglucosamine 2-epimerase (non-hydrolysing)
MAILIVVHARTDVFEAATLAPELARAGIGWSVVVADRGDDDSHVHDAMTILGGSPDAVVRRLDVTDGEGRARLGSSVSAFETVMESIDGDLVMVTGGSDVALSAALAAAKAHRQIVHYRAGQRCSDLQVPEQMNSAVIARMASMHFAATEKALENLEDEGVEPERIHFVGSLAAQAALGVGQPVRMAQTFEELGVERGKYVVASLSHRDNLSNPERLRGIARGLNAANSRVIVPDGDRLHEALTDAGAGLSDNIVIASRLLHEDMVGLIRGAAAVVTDTASVQVESCVCETPCVTVMDCTEADATVACGANVLVDAEESAIAIALHDAMTAHRKWTVPKRWDTAVSDRLVRALRRGVIPLS